MQPHPFLWLDPARRASIARRAAAGDPTAAGIARRARAEAAAPASGDARRHAGACALAHWLDGGQAFAERAVDTLLAASNLKAGELTRGADALCAAVVHDGCAAALDAPRARALRRLLFDLCRSFRVIDLGCGDPHVVTNNHWAVAHAAAGIAAMAIHGWPADEAGAGYDMAEDIAWARGRMRPFLMHHGDRGLYHEGLGYQMYPAAFWLPFVLASQSFDGLDYLADFPNLRQMGPSLYAAVAARPAGGERRGVKLVWNDDSPEWHNSAVPVLMMHIAPPAQGSALRWLYDRLNGAAGDAQFGPDFTGWFFSLLYYPYDTAPADPNGLLPLHLTDSRQGLTLVRNRYRDGDDAILGAYARVTHVGGHAQDDAGSVRFMALGHDWITGGGQARGQAEFQSLVTPSDGSRQKKPLGCGAVICDERTEDGAVFGMDLRRPSVAYAERWLAVDYSRRSGAEAVLALLDLVDDHAARDWDWNLSFEAGLEACLQPDGAGFDLRAADGAVLHARFLGMRPVSLALERMPDSERPYQSGDRKRYPGGPYLRAHFAKCAHLGIYVVMTVTRGTAPVMKGGERLAVTVGAWTWERPFGAAIPAVFRPGESGILCRYPSGLRV